MIKLFGKTGYKVRINYKSGIQEEFWVTNFKISGDTYSWKGTSPGNKPVHIGVEDIESVWQIDYCKPIFGGNNDI